MMQRVCVLAVEAYNADNPKEGLRRLKQSTPLIKLCTSFLLVCNFTSKNVC